MSPPRTVPDPPTPGESSGREFRNRLPFRETTFLLPLAGLFAPESDPSLRFPDHFAEVQGYAVADDGTVAVSIVGEGPHAAALLDEVWAGLERKGLVVRRMAAARTNDPPTAAITLRLDLGPTICAMLRASLLLPVRAQAGQAEVHVLGTAREAEAIGRALEAEGIPPISVRAGPPDPTVAGTRLTAEDWAFLGLLSSLGVFDGPEHPNEAAAARLVGFADAEFAVKVRTVEAGMRSLVAGLFAPPEEAGGAAVAG
jgi:hypothetical protein